LAKKEKQKFKNSKNKNKNKKYSCTLSQSIFARVMSRNNIIKH